MSNCPVEQCRRQFGAACGTVSHAVMHPLLDLDTVYGHTRPTLVYTYLRTRMFYVLQKLSGSVVCLRAVCFTTNINNGVCNDRMDGALLPAADSYEKGGRPGYCWHKRQNIACGLLADYNDRHAHISAPPPPSLPATSCFPDASTFSPDPDGEQQQRAGHTRSSTCIQPYIQARID